MLSLTTNVFELPDHLTAKADPLLIADDERHFAQIAQTLDQTVADLTARVDATRKERGGSGQQALERDLEIHRLTARLRMLRRQDRVQRQIIGIGHAGGGGSHGTVA